jgi:hypothetical protein
MVSISVAPGVTVFMLGPLAPDRLSDTAEFSARFGERSSHARVIEQLRWGAGRPATRLKRCAQITKAV